MPRIAPSIHGGSATADRVLSLLSAFRAGDTGLSLAELSSRTGLYKSTALRLLNSLQAAGYIAAQEDGYRLAGEILRLHGIASAVGSLEAVVMPVLRKLVDATKETAALHIQRGMHRVRLYTVDSPHPLREHVQPGEELPLDRGAGGLVLLAFSGAAGGKLETIRKQGYALSIGGRLPELSGIAAPVFRAGGDLVGALTLTMPTQRWKKSWCKAVVENAEKLTRALGGETKGSKPKRKSSSQHSL